MKSHLRSPNDTSVCLSAVEHLAGSVDLLALWPAREPITGQSNSVASEAVRRDRLPASNPPAGPSSSSIFFSASSRSNAASSMRLAVAKAKHLRWHPEARRAGCRTLQMQLQTRAVRPDVWSNHQDGDSDWDSSTGRTRRSGVTNTALQLRPISGSLGRDLVPASRLAGKP